MSDWLMKPTNSIEEELFAKGYCVFWLWNNTYQALAPEGQKLTFFGVLISRPLNPKRFI